MKTKKRIFSVIANMLMLALIFSMLTSCGGKDNADSEKEAELKSAEGVASAMFDELIKGDGLADPGKYIDSASNVDFEFLNIRSAMEKSIGMDDFSGLEEFMGKENVQNYINTIWDKIIEKLSYNIKSSEFAGDNIVVHASIEYPDFDKSENITAELEKAFGEESVLGIFGVSSEEEIITKFMEKQNLSEEEFVQKYIAAEDQNAIVNDFFKAFEPEINSYMLSVVNNILPNLAVSSEDVDLTLQKQSDGAWKITESSI